MEKIEIFITNHHVEKYEVGQVDMENSQRMVKKIFTAENSSAVEFSDGEIREFYGLPYIYSKNSNLIK